jgi:hypothetical protein
MIMRLQKVLTHSSNNTTIIVLPFVASASPYLSSKDMLNFTGSNTKGQRSKSTVRCRVRVTAHRDGTGKGKALFGSNNVDDSLTLVGKGKVGETKGLDILLELHDLRSTGSLFNEGFHIDNTAAVTRGHVVIDRRQSAVRSSHAAASETEAFKCLRRRYFVNQVTINVDERRDTVIVDQVIIPDLVDERSFTASSSSKQRRRRSRSRRRLERVRASRGSKARSYTKDGAKQRYTDAQSHGWILAVQSNSPSDEKSKEEDMRAAACVNVWEEGDREIEEGLCRLSPDVAVLMSSCVMREEEKE